MEISSSQKLVYGVYFMLMFLAALIAIQITHLIVLGSFNNEISHLIDTLGSATVGVIFRAKI